MSRDHMKWGAAIALLVLGVIGIGYSLFGGSDLQSRRAPAQTPDSSSLFQSQPAPVQQPLPAPAAARMLDADTEGFKKLKALEEQHSEIENLKHQQQMAQLEAAIAEAKANEAEAIKRAKGQDKSEPKPKSDTVAQGSDESAQPSKVVIKPTESLAKGAAIPSLRYLTDDHVVIEREGQLLTIFRQGSTADRYSITSLLPSEGRATIKDRKLKKEYELSMRQLETRIQPTLYRESEKAAAPMQGAGVVPGIDESN